MSQWKSADIAAAISTTINIFAFISCLCHSPTGSHRQQLFNKLLLQVLVFSFIGKCVMFLILCELFDANHSGNCNFIAFMLLFADNGGLYFYSLALMVSFAPVIVLFKKIEKIIDNPNTLQNQKHFYVWCFVLIMSCIPLLFNAYGHDNHQCYVNKQWVLLLFYRVIVYIFGVLFLCCSIHTWIKTRCLKRFNRYQKFKTFVTLILLPLFFILFSIPFELHDICKELGCNSHKWDNISVTWGIMFGTAVSIIYLVSSWQTTLAKKMNFSSTSDETETDYEECMFLYTHDVESSDQLKGQNETLTGSMTDDSVPTWNPAQQEVSVTMLSK